MKTNKAKLTKVQKLILGADLPIGSLMDSPVQSEEEAQLDADTAATTAATPQQAFHYFAATGLNWATADTRQKAIEMLAADAGSCTIARTVEKHGGLFVQSFRVELPGDAKYKIFMYQPVDVPLSEKQVHRITSCEGHLIACEVE